MRFATLHKNSAPSRCAAKGRRRVPNPGMIAGPKETAMTQINVNAPALPRGALAIHSAISAIETLVAEIALWNARRNTARALARLSDRQLADIGLLGADLNEVAARLRR